MYDLISVFLKEKSFANYSDAAVLQCFLDAAGVRGDTEEMITSMFEAFGSFKGVLEAKPDQLMSLPTVTKKVATLISMIVPLSRSWERANMADVQRIKNANDASAYCKSLLMGERNEHFFVIALNAQGKVIGTRRISEGTLSECSAYPRSVMETALNYNAHGIILSHNHPGGTCAPSAEDISSTHRLQKMLQDIGIQILDHIIVAGSDTYSMSRHGDIRMY